MPLVRIKKKYPGIKIRSLAPASCFYRAGLRSGDTVLSLNGKTVSTELDFRFLAADPVLKVGYLRAGGPRSCTVIREPGRFPDIEFFAKPILRCANRCIFCFIDQMPGGLRKSLYVKDEDLSHSFLNGNYVTLTNAGPAVLEKIADTGLSPLYVSVHAADPAIRNRMLGVKRGPAIMDQLVLLTRKGIRVHTQIVVCPGYNDGAVLVHTVRQLFALGEGLLSIAVVPVGLTRFRAFPLEPVDRENAAAICSSVSRLSDEDARRTGGRRLFLADELFLRAGLPLPPRSYYGEYPQIENGVGLLRQLLDEWNQARAAFRAAGAPVRAARRAAKRYLLVTSVSAYPFLAAIAAQAARARPETAITVVPVINRFFGESVTVAGLLSAADVLREVRGRRGHGVRVLAPAVMFNYAGFTLDGYSARRLSKKSGVPFVVLHSIKDLLSI